ncbi:jg23574, partial [Pararge aegeria aegeria]
RQSQNDDEHPTHRVVSDSPYSLTRLAKPLSYGNISNRLKGARSLLHLLPFANMELFLGSRRFPAILCLRRSPNCSLHLMP